METTTSPNWLKEPATIRKCPKCKTGSLDTRIPRGFFVKHIFRMNLKRYKCQSCGSQVYVRA